MDYQQLVESITISIRGKIIMETRDEGCGIWPLLLKNTRFYPACVWHDHAYTEDSWAQNNYGRLNTDRWFLKQSLEIAGGSIYHKARAYLFFGLARVFGKIFWEGKN